MLEGHENSIIRRETEKFLDVITTRNELGGRAMRNYRMACDVPPLNRDVYLRQATSKYMDIHLGVRFYTFGEGIERKTLFMPIDAGGDAVDRIYYNLEHIIHQNLVAYDEVHDHYLPVSEELVARELEGVLYRATRKDNTRKKLINGLKMHTVLLEDASMNNHISLADFYYDKLNRIDLLDEAAQRSREMFSTALIRSTELTGDAGVNVNELKMEERVYIERPKSQEQATVAATVSSTTAPSTPAPEQAAPPPAAPATPEEGQEEEEEATTTHTDGLEEL